MTRKNFSAASLSAAPIALLVTASTIAAMTALPRAARADDPPKPTTPPVPAPATPPAPAAPTRDPAAQKVITDMAAAYKALNGYAAKIDFTVKQGDATIQSFSEQWSFARPDKFSIKTTDGQQGANRNALSDGKALYTTISTVPNKYRKVGLSQGGGVARMLAGLHAGFPVIGILLTDPEAAQHVIPAPASLALGPDDKVGTDDVKVVVASLPAQPTGTAPKLTFYIGKSDNLLRRISANITEQGKTVIVTEAYSDSKGNPTFAESTFTFTPTPGMTEADPPTPPAKPAPAPGSVAPIPKPAEPAKPGGAPKPAGKP